jgi:hypothetical protein
MHKRKFIYRVYGAYGTEKDFKSPKKANEYVKEDPESRVMIKLLG